MTSNSEQLLPDGTTIVTRTIPVPKTLGSAAQAHLATGETWAPEDGSPGRHIVHLLNQYISGQYYDNRTSMLKLADVPAAMNEGRIGTIKRAVQVSGDQIDELPIQRDGSWAEVRIAQLGVHALIVLEH